MNCNLNIKFEVSLKGEVFDIEDYCTSGDTVHTSNVKIKCDYGYFNIYDYLLQIPRFSIGETICIHAHFNSELNNIIHVRNDMHSSISDVISECVVDEMYIIVVKLTTIYDTKYIFNYGDNCTLKVDRMNLDHLIPLLSKGDFLIIKKINLDIDKCHWPRKAK